MSIKIDKLEKNKVQLTVDVSKEKLEEGLSYSYNKNKSSLSVAGFRKGKAPRLVIEQTYGENIFYEDAVNHIIDDVYQEAIKEANLNVIDRPENIDIPKINPKEGAVFTFSVLVEPEVTLGQYKDFEIPKISYEVTEDEVDEELNYVREQNVRLVSISDRNINDGDVVSINFLGFIDNEPFEGGEAHDYDIEIGSHSFIDTFEEQLIGHAVGDDIEIFVTFPDNYHIPELAKKPAMFKVEILDIKEKCFPNIDDELAQDVSEFDTLDEYKQFIRDSLLNKKQAQAKMDVQENIIKVITENAEIDVPDVMIDEELTNILDRFHKNFELQNMSLSYYLTVTGQNYDQLKESFRPGALKNVSARLALSQIAKEEGITVEQEEFYDYLKEMEYFKNVSNETNIDELYEKIPYSEIMLLKKDLLINKTLDFIKSTLTEV